MKGYNSNQLPTDYTYTSQEDVGFTRAPDGDDPIRILDYGARTYWPDFGRFISPDTIVPEPGNPQSLNRYSYVNNNPLRYTDPTGFFTEDEIMQYLDVNNWDAVLAMFWEGGQYAGSWGWLEVLREAELGDSVGVWLGNQSYLAGSFDDQDGQLLFTSSIDGVDVSWSANDTTGLMAFGGNPNVAYWVGNSFVHNHKHTHIIFHPGRVDWTDFGLDAVGSSDTLGYMMMGTGIVAVSAGTGGIVTLLGGVVIVGLATAADGVSAGKAVADYQRGNSTGTDLAVDLGLGVGGVIPGVGLYADAASITRDLAPGIYIGP